MKKKFNNKFKQRERFGQGQGRGQFENRPPQFERFKKPDPIVHYELKDVNQELLNKSIIVIARIDRIAQTGGPTIFSVSDGTMTLALKGFTGAGERSYPGLKEGDSVKATVVINEYNDELEGEIKKIEKLTPQESQILEDKIVMLQRERAKVQEIPFLVKSQILDKLRPSMIKAAQEIRLAIIQSRPIIVRHHNDTDGYCSGYALEKAILPLIEKEHGSEKASYEFFSRSPSQAPFYEIDDSIRDTALALRNEAKFSNKMPLVIISDNGSTPEDLFAIKQGKVHGMDFIVVDHHYFDKDVISQEVLVHISPFLVGEDGSCFSAGMLSAELARLINPVEGLDILPAIAGLADRIELKNPSVIDEYLQITKKQGYDKNLLVNISKVIDFVSAKVRFMEVREYIGIIFGEPRNKQKELVALMAPYIIGLEEKGLEIARRNVKLEKINDINLQLLEIENVFPGFGFYPKPGKCVGMIHDDCQKTKNFTNLITLGLMNTAITIRATEESNFSTHKLISFLREHSPNSFVEGGGHKNAGSITFLPQRMPELLKLTKDFIKGLKK